MDEKKKIKPMPLLLKLLLIALAVLVVAEIFFTGQSKPYSSVGFAMDTVVEQQWYGPKAEKFGQASLSAMEKLEAEYSLYVEDSVVWRLNEQAGKDPTAVSDEAFSFLQRSAALCGQSQGRFDITIAPLVLAWGITTEAPRVPPQKELDILVGLVDWRDILFYPETAEVQLARKGQKIDLGGLAKGYACDLLRDMAEEYKVTGGYVMVGSSVLVIGEKPQGEPFRFGIQDPRGARGQSIGTLTMGKAGNAAGAFDVFSTSGDYERFFTDENGTYHHIFDPATGRPAQTDIASVVIVGRDGLMTEFYSTYLFMGGSADLPDPAVEEYGYIAITADKVVYCSDNLRESFELKSDFYRMAS
ncbi:FAD:protein FMN transferase [Oscillospiraceae bacterium MB08-C2-2]|nr:FAD:protein FMN transferase [Oscillospiraceae bacterium MB08-C2-2]